MHQALNRAVEFVQIFRLVSDIWNDRNGSWATHGESIGEIVEMMMIRINDGNALKPTDAFASSAMQLLPNLPSIAQLLVAWKNITEFSESVLDTLSWSRYDNANLTELLTNHGKNSVAYNQMITQVHLVDVDQDRSDAKINAIMQFLSAIINDKSDRNLLHVCQRNRHKLNAFQNETIKFRMHEAMDPELWEEAEGQRRQESAGGLQEDRGARRGGAGADRGHHERAAAPRVRREVW